VTRCDDIISQLLDFARTKSLQSELLAFDDWLSRLIEEEAQRLPEVVAIECHLGLGEEKVTFDPARMSRVLINLLSNASEALVGKGDDLAKFAATSPRIVITSKRTMRGIEISVADNGLGISEENLKKIFEPLFTTKSFGTGLGLPAVEKILEQHGGGLEVSSTQGNGAVFTAWFPHHAAMEMVV
jgi:signal transduction histidine kinase